MVRGFVHVHSEFSRDGLSSIADLAAFAREAQLRFVGLTDHAEDLSTQDVVDLRRECEEHSNESCVILPGLEFRCRGDIHILSLGSAELICHDDPVVVASRITQTGGLAILAHPGRIGHRCPEELVSVLTGIEVWNAAYDGRFVPTPASLRLLQKMRLINPSLFGIGGADLHGLYRPPGVILGLPLNGCQLVDANAILQLLKAGMFLVSGKYVRFDARLGPHRLARIPLWSFRKLYEASKAIRDMALGEA